MSATEVISLVAEAREAGAVLDGVVARVLAESLHPGRPEGYYLAVEDRAHARGEIKRLRSEIAKWEALQSAAADWQDFWSERDA